MPQSMHVESFEELAMPHLAAVARYAHALARDVALAEDLVQDTYLLAAENWHTFTPGSECRAWLFTICRNRFLRLRKREERQEPVVDATLESLASVRGHRAAREAGLEGAFERQEVIDAVYDAIAALPEPFREVAVLVDLNDLSYDAAAAVLGVPVGTVRSRLFRARRVLQEQLLVHARDLGITDRPSQHSGSAR